MKVLELDLKVRIAEKLLNKIEVITSDFNMEVSGFLIGKIKDDRIIIKDIIFPKQVVTGDSVDIEAKDILPLRNDPRWNNVLGLWHSHCHMTPFFSGSEGDESHIKFISDAKDVSVFIVSAFNQNRHQHLVRVEIKKPFKMSIEEVPLIVIKKHNNQAGILREIKSYTSVKKIEPVQTPNVGLFYPQPRYLSDFPFPDNQSSKAKLEKEFWEAYYDREK